MMVTRLLVSTSEDELVHHCQNKWIASLSRLLMLIMTFLVWRKYVVV